MDNKSIIHAMIATFLALGEAAGEQILQRAGDYIRRLLADDIMDPAAAEILETVLVGIEGPSNCGAAINLNQLGWLDQLDAATVH